MKKDDIIEIVALLYVCLLLYTGIDKLLDLELNREKMAMMPLVGPLSGIISWLLPVCEIVLAIFLFIPKTRNKSLYPATGLMVAFTLYVIYLVSFTDQQYCTCGGFLDSLSWPQHLIFNIAFVLMGVWAINIWNCGTFWQPRKKSNYQIKIG
ncbi:MAG: hypothetical protein QHC79_25615 [Pseudosphingobacterium sp.]|nr:hypothetical protein [Pseudosphingobacterium sp.]